MNPCRGCGVARLEPSPDQPVVHCTKCHETKPSYEFSPRPRPPYWYSHCRECRTAQTREWQRRTKGRAPRVLQTLPPVARASCGSGVGVSWHRRLGERVVDCDECRRFLSRKAWVKSEARKRRQQERQLAEADGEFIPLWQTILDVAATYDSWVRQSVIVDKVCDLRGGSVNRESIRQAFARMLREGSIPWEVERRETGKAGSREVFVRVDHDRVYDLIAS